MKAYTDKQHELALWFAEALEATSKSRWHINKRGRIINQHRECPIEAVATELYGEKPRSIEVFEARDRLGMDNDAAWIVIASADNAIRSPHFSPEVRRALLRATMAERSLLSLLRSHWRTFREFSQSVREWTRS